MVSARAGEQNLTLGELITGEKSNEIKAGCALPERLPFFQIRRLCGLFFLRKIRYNEAPMESFDRAIAAYTEGALFTAFP